MTKLEYVTVLPGELCSAFYIVDSDQRNSNPLYQTLNINGKLYLKLQKRLFPSKNQACTIRKKYNLPITTCNCIYPKGRIKLVSKYDFEKFSDMDYCGTFDYLMPLSQLADKESFDALPITDNELVYSDAIAKFMTVGHDDRKWLCNKIANLYEEIDDGCVDSFRVSPVLDGGKWSEQYNSKITCCGQVDKKIINPKTGNKFWIGFNYGH